MVATSLIEMELLFYMLRFVFVLHAENLVVCFLLYVLDVLVGEVIFSSFFH